MPTADPQADEFDRRLARREAELRERTAALIREIAEAEPTAGRLEAETLAALHRELDCIVSARDAVATLRPGVASRGLPAHRRA